MISYGVLALITWRTMEGPLQWALWVFFAGLALKTWIAAYRPD